MEIEKVDYEFSDADYKFSETSAGKLLKIEPLELKFSFEPSKKMSCSLYLSNVTPNLVAFQVLTSNLKNNFGCRQNPGIILPHTTCGITVTIEAQKAPPADMKCTDIFTIQSVVFTRRTTRHIMKLFNKEEGQYIEECKLPVVYLSPPIPLLPLPVEPYSFLTQNGNVMNCSERAAMELLKIDQQELQFPFKANKQISCSLQLLNITESPVAFKVKTTHPKKFCVKPKNGIVLPRSTCDIIVTVQAQKKVLPEMQQKEKFLIQSAVVRPGTPEKDVDWEMLKHAGRIKDYKLRAVYTFPHQAPIEVAKGSEECSSEVVSLSGKNASLDVSQETSKSCVQENLGHGSSAFASEECSSEIAFLGNDSSDISQGSVRRYIQRNLGRVSSTFERILDSLRFTSSFWIFRNKSTDDYQRLMG